MTWNVPEFETWFNGVDDPIKRQRALSDLTPAQRKVRKEWRTFRQFASAVNLDVDPRGIENCAPPEPDILCEISGVSRFFELGEITDESIPRNESVALRNGSDIHGGSISQLAALDRVLFAKCGKVYRTGGARTDLLLHYNVGHQVPCPQTIHAVVSESIESIRAALSTSSFDAIWIFDCWTDRLLAAINR